MCWKNDKILIFPPYVWSFSGTASDAASKRQENMAGLKCRCLLFVKMFLCALN